jgi:hypothetical protein
MPVESRDTRQRDERRFRRIAILSFIMYLSVLATYVVVAWLF